MSRTIGAILQGLVLGALLTWAQLNAIAAATHAVIFQYQGY